MTNKPIPIAHKSQRVTAEATGSDAGDMQASESMIASEVEAEAHDAPPVKPGILHNKHDAHAAAQEVGKVIAALGRFGVPVNINEIDLRNLRARADSFAACRLLIAKGIATEDEVATEAFTVLRVLLLDILNAVEAQRDQGKVQAVRKPGIVVARQ